eukprot:8130053-Pyramimonas_sp.AAC.1
MVMQLFLLLPGADASTPSTASLGRVHGFCSARAIEEHTEFSCEKKQRTGSTNAQGVDVRAMAR